MTPITIDEEIAELLAAGWTKVCLTTWRSPDGYLYRGPHGAWLIHRSTEQPLAGAPGYETRINENGHRETRPQEGR